LLSRKINSRDFRHVESKRFVHRGDLARIDAALAKARGCRLRRSIPIGEHGCRRGESPMAPSLDCQFNPESDTWLWRPGPPCGGARIFRHAFHGCLFDAPIRWLLSQNADLRSDSGPIPLCRLPFLHECQQGNLRRNLDPAGLPALIARFWVNLVHGFCDASPTLCRAVGRAPHWRRRGVPLQRPPPSTVSGNGQRPP
jgi:hypothetical protein